MTKKYLNKDYQMYRLEYKGQKEYREYFDFKLKFIDRFSPYKEEDMLGMYGFNQSEAYKRLLERDYDIMFVVTQDKEHVIISNDEKEMIDFFESNAPMHLIRKCKRVIGLRTFGKSREYIKYNFEANTKHLHSLYYDEYMESKRKKKNRDESLVKLL